MPGQAAVSGQLGEPKPYFVLTRWRSGVVGAVQWCDTDRLLPRPVEGTAGIKEPAISGIGPIGC
jgi:hypothetical protein